MQAINAKFLGYDISFFLALFTIAFLVMPGVVESYGVARFILVPFVAQACNLIIGCAQSFAEEVPAAR